MKEISQPTYPPHCASCGKSLPGEVSTPELRCARCAARTTDLERGDIRYRELLLSAHAQGYAILADGKIRSKTRRIVSGYVKELGGIPYRCFSLVFEGKPTNMLVHRLQAYQKYGLALFAPGIQVRHLDRNSLNNSADNVGLGSSSDNSFDRPREERVRSAKVAARAQRLLSDEQVCQLRRDRADGMSYASLMAKYGIAKSTVSYVVNRKTYQS